MARSIESFVAGVRGHFDADLEARRPPETRRKLRSVRHQCGWKALSAQRLLALEEALLAEGIFTHPEISDPSLDLDTYVRFSLEPVLEVGRIVKPEKALGYMLSKQPELLEAAIPGLKILRHMYGGQTRERPYRLHDREVIPDLVFSAGRGKKVVCELKSAGPTRGGTPQLEEYVLALEARGDEVVAAVLVSGRPSSRTERELTLTRVEHMRSRGVNAHWVTYDVELTVQEARGATGP